MGVNDQPEGAHATVDEAFVAAWAELDELARTRTANVETRGGGSYAYSYADLSDVLRAVRTVYARHGLAVTQPVAGGNGTVSVGTVLVHTTGGRIVSPVLELPATGTPQAVGSAITYARRYSLLATCGLATEDDDAAAAKPQRAAPRKRTAATPRAAKTPEQAQTARAMAMFGELGYASRDDRLVLTSAIVGRETTSWNDLNIDERRAVIDYLESELEGPPEPEEGY